MAKPGPSPKPAAIKALEGNPGKRPAAQDAPNPAVLTNLKAPSFLPPAAKREWKRVVMELARLNLISDLDVMALAAYCNTYSTWLHAIGEIKKNGMVVKTPNGFFQTSQFVKIERDAQEQMLKWLKEFGMTPAARTRVGTDSGEDEDDDPFEALAKRAGQNKGGLA